MISVDIRLAGGAIRALDSRGHAAAAGDISLPCAAVSALLRSFVAALGESETVSAEGDTSGPGTLTIRVGRVSDERWLRGAGDMLLSGLRQVASEFPDEVELRVSRES